MLERPIGAGASSVVYQATDTRLKRSVAIKIRRFAGVRPARRDEERARFRQVGRTLEALAHPHIIAVHETGETEDGDSFLVMELAAQPSFEGELEARGKLGLEEVLQLLLPIMGALAYAHERGIVHRDVKPANLAIERHERHGVRPKLLDFGIAKLPGTATDPGVTFGTPSYMAPEQVRAELVGPYTDVWAVGVLFFRALSGRVPFEARDIESLQRKIAREPPPSLASVVHDLPTRVTIAVDRALASDVRARYANMRDFAKALVVACRMDGVRLPRAPDPIGLPDFDEWLAQAEAESTMRLERDDAAPRARTEEACAVEAAGQSQSADAPQVLARPFAEPTNDVVASEVPFVGRKAELAALEQRFTEVERGARGAVVVLGASGLGKTTLVERFTDALSAERRALVLRGRCYVNEDVPYRALHGVLDALADHLAALSPSEVQGVLPRDTRALALLFPRLMRVEAIRAAPAVRTALSDSALERERAVAALRELLARLSDRLPVVLFIDDLQWDDEDSARLLAEVLAEPSPPSLLFAATCRDREREHSHVLRALGRDRALSAATSEIALSPLASHETIELATSATRAAHQDDSLTHKIANESGGHPMFAIELARFARAPRPEGPLDELSLDAALRGRADGLTGEARLLLELACVAGRKLKIKAALDGEVGPIVRELSARRLLTASGVTRDDTVEVCHDRLREALLSAMPEEHARALHRRLARSLLAEPSPRYDLVVEHYVSAGSMEEAARHALAAADQAESVLAHHRVPGLLELAIAHAHPSDQPQLCKALARACAQVGRTRDATRAYLRAAELEQDPDKRWNLNCLSMWQALQGGEVELGVTLLDKLDRSFGVFGLRLTFWRVVFSTCLYLVWSVFGPPKLRASAAPSERTTRAQQKLQLAWNAATGLLDTHPGKAAYFGIAAFDLAARLGHAAHYAPMYATFVTSRSIRAGRASVAVEEKLRHARRIAQERGDTTSQQFVRLTEIMYLLFTSQATRAADLMSSLLETQFASTPVGAYARRIARDFTAPVFFWSGRLARTRVLTGPWIREANELGQRRAEHGLRATGAHRFLCEDDAESACAEWLASTTGDPEGGVLREAVWGAVIGFYARNLPLAQQALAHSRRSFFRWAAYVAPGRVTYAWAKGSLAAARLASGERGLGVRMTLAFVRAWLACERTSFARPLAHHLAAAHAALRGDRRRCVRELERAQSAFSRAGLRLFAACASRALAVIAPESVRAADQASADEVFAAEALREPLSWVHALLPGVLVDAQDRREVPSR